jgi:hypothetical protein
MTKAPGTTARAPRRRRRVIVATVVLLVLGGIAAGVLLITDSSSKRRALSAAQVHEVRMVVHSYIAAVDQHNGEQLCALLSPAAQQAFITDMAPYAQGDCPSLAAAAVSQLPGGATPTPLASVKILRVSGSPTLAVANVLIASHSDSLAVTRINGRWLLAPGAPLLSQNAGSDQLRTTTNPCSSQLSQVAQHLVAPGEAADC